MANHTTLQARTSDSELTLSQHTTDSPILPTAQLERLHQFRPDKVDWVFEQTQAEAEHRRTQDARINGFILIERLVGQSFGLIVALAGLAAAAYMATNGAPWPGAILGGGTLLGMVTVFVVGRSSPPATKKQPDDAGPKPKRK